MIFHRLRVLRLSKSLLSIKVSSKKETCVKGNTEDDSKIENKVALQMQNLNENATTCKKSTSGSVEPSVKPRLQSETMIPPKTVNNLTNRKTTSLSNLRRQFSLKKIICSNRIKQKLQSYKRKIVAKQDTATKHEVKVIYVAESSILKRRRSFMHHRKALPRSSCDRHGFLKNKRQAVYNLSTIYQRFNKEKLRNINVRKNKKVRKVVAKYPYHHHLKVVATGRIYSQPRVCTDLPDIPQSIESKQRQEKALQLCRREGFASDAGFYYISSVNCTHRIGRKLTPGQTVQSCLKSPVTVDKAVSMCKSVMLPPVSPPCTAKRHVSKSGIALRKCTRSKRKFPTPIFIKKHACPMKSIGFVCYFILYGLVILVWSPCILIVGLSWLLTYPLKPRDILSAKNRKHYKRNEHGNDDHCKYDFGGTFIGLSRRVAKATSISGKVIYSLLRLKKENKPEHLPHCRSHPDPGRRYTLSHADGRGWVIKPLRTPHRMPPNQNRFLHSLKHYCDFPKIAQRSSRVKRTTNAAKHTGVRWAIQESTTESCKSAAGNQKVVKEEQCCFNYGDRIIYSPPSKAPTQQKLEEPCKSCGIPYEPVCITREAKSTDATVLSGTYHDSLSNKEPHQSVKEAKPVDTEIVSCSCNHHLSNKEPSQSVKEAKSADTKFLNSSCRHHFSNKKPRQSVKEAKSADTEIISCSCHHHLSNKESRKSVKEAKSADTEIISCSCHHHLSNKESRKSVKEAKSADTEIISCSCHHHLSNKESRKSVKEAKSADTEIISCSCHHHLSNKESRKSVKEAKSADTEIISCSCHHHLSNKVSRKSVKEAKSADTEIIRCSCHHHLSNKESRKSVKEAKSADTEIISCSCHHHLSNKESRKSVKEAKTARICGFNIPLKELCQKKVKKTKNVSSCCGHNMPDKELCQRQVKKTNVSSCCGHNIPVKELCQIKVKKMKNVSSCCGHNMPDKELCQKQVKKTNVSSYCGHNIPVKELCQIKVNKMKNVSTCCGHNMPDKELCQKQVNKSKNDSSCGHNIPVKELCQKRVKEVKNVSSCGHNIPVKELCQKQVKEAKNVSSCGHNIPVEELCQKRVKEAKTVSSRKKEDKKKKRKNVLADTKDPRVSQCLTKVRECPSVRRISNPRKVKRQALIEHGHIPSKSGGSQNRNISTKNAQAKSRNESKTRDKSRSPTKTTTKKNKLRNFVDCCNSDCQDTDAVCCNLYLSTLREKPWFWIYKRYPSVYPWFLRWYYCSKTCCYHSVLSISIGFWALVACWCYGCYELVVFCCCCNK